MNVRSKELAVCGLTYVVMRYTILARHLKSVLLYFADVSAKQFVRYVTAVKKRWFTGWIISSFSSSRRGRRLRCQNYCFQSRSVSTNRIFRDRCLQATVCLGLLKSWTAILLVLVSRLQRAVTVSSFYLTVSSMTLAPGFGLFIRSGASWSWYGTIGWWQALLRHEWLLTKLLIDRVDHALRDNGSEWSNKALAIDGLFDQR